MGTKRGPRASERGADATADVREPRAVRAHILDAADTGQPRRIGGDNRGDPDPIPQAQQQPTTTTTTAPLQHDSRGLTWAMIPRSCNDTVTVAADAPLWTPGEGDSFELRFDVSPTYFFNQDRPAPTDEQ